MGGVLSESEMRNEGDNRKQGRASGAASGDIFLSRQKMGSIVRRNQYCNPSYLLNWLFALQVKVTGYGTATQRVD